MTCPACGLVHPHLGARWFCWLATNDRRYQRLWSLPETAPEVRPPVPEWVVVSGKKEKCRHFGEVTGESVECPSCAGHVSLKLFACEVFGKCTPGKRVEGVACCVGCEMYEARVE